MIPEEMCRGSCQGRPTNCPYPRACGWPREKKSSFLENVITFLLTLALVFALINIIYLGVSQWL